MARRTDLSSTTIPSRALLFPCTECGKDAFMGYSSGRKKEAWDGKVKKGERLCTSCFQKRGGKRFL